jgi:hypothetical protein
MPYKPFGHERYARAIPESARSALASAQTSLINHIADTAREAEAAMQRQLHEDQQRFLHSSDERALRASVAQEGYKGQPDCTHGNWRNLTGD